MAGCRSAEEADSQALRAAILLDELDAPALGVADTRTGSVIAELKAWLPTPQEDTEGSWLR